MANTTETVFVEFVVNDDQLENTTDTLERTGKIDKTAADQFKKTNAELAKRQQTIDGLNKKLRETQAQNAKTIADLQAKTETFIKDFVSGFSEGVVETLQEAGFEFDEFGKIIGKTDNTVKKSSKSLKGELRAITQELAQMKLRGEDNTEQYQALAKRAGEMKDAIGDAANEINNFASDTSKIDGLINVAQGVAGAFAIAQGAVGLFGAENEELNEVLLRVNSAMAILQGLQAVGNVLQKESAGSTFLAATAQQIYNIAVGQSVGLLKALRIALALTGVGAIIIGITLLAQWLTRASKATKELTKDFTRFNLEAQRDIDNFKNNINEVNRANAERQADLKAQGALQSKITSENIKGMKEELVGIFELQKSMRARRDEAILTLTQMANKERKFNEALADEAQKTIDMFNDLGQQRLDIASQIRIQEIENEKQRNVERLQAVADGLQSQLVLATKNSKKELDLAKQVARAQAAIQLEEAGQNLPKRLLIEKELQAKLRELDREFARVRQADRIAGAERELLAVQQRARQINERTTQEEIDAQKRVALENARLDLMQEGLTSNQRLKIWEDYFNTVQQLQKDFNKQSNEQSLNDAISRNNAELAQLNLTNGERTRLQEENLITAAQIEIDANRGLTDKIKEIRAKLEVDLRALRLASLQKELEYELAFEEARTGALRRASERTAANESKGLNARIAAINQIAALDIAALDAKDDANKEALRNQLIDQKEYNLRYAQLQDEELKITEDTEIKKRALKNATLKQQILFALETAQQVASIIAQFGQQETEAEQARIEAQRTEIDELREAGAITEKEALARQKKLDQEERAIKRKQAERDKAVALFSAIINTAAAVVKALPNLVLAGIAAALGLAQVALIASKPIPKFGKGKKGNYEGPAEIGETGAELMESNGRMYLAKKRTFVWVGKQDKVFNPKETAAMLEKNNMQPYIIKDGDTKQYKSVYESQIDYDKLGKVIAGNIPKTSLNVDQNGFTEFVHYKSGFTQYLNNRRSY